MHDATNSSTRATHNTTRSAGGTSTERSRLLPTGCFSVGCVAGGGGVAAGDERAGGDVCVAAVGGTGTQRYG